LVCLPGLRETEFCPLMFCPARCLLLVMFLLSLGGCHNPARPNVPQVTHQQRQADWRKEIVPGIKADRAMAYLLTRGFDCQVTRNHQGQVERISAKERQPLRDASGAAGAWQIDLAVQEDRIQTVKITPLSQR
jgi:hypothetical protein